MMRRRRDFLLSAWLLLHIVAGCHVRTKPAPRLHRLDAVATKIEYPDMSACTHCSFVEVAEFEAPRAIRKDGGKTEHWDLSLEEAISLALQNNDVLKDLGGRVLTNPDAVPTAYDPAIRESDPLFGTEGALSAFDAQIATNLFWQNNDRVFNNRITGGGVNQFTQDLSGLDSELSKVAATGARFSVRSRTEYDANNSPTADKIFPSAWQSWFEAGVRQPLLQGAGVTFNRIAGPNSQPGFNFSSGVMVARINTDISLADFEAGVINFVSEVENAYWELYFAYRELGAAMEARDAALKTWRNVEARYENNLPGGEAFKEARARAQYFQFQDQVQDSLNGVPTRGRSVGVYRGERRLRTLMGLPTSGRRLIRPSDAPAEARLSFAWSDVLDEALGRRVELRKQMWRIKRNELELIAARNFILPRLDALVTYRVRGFGNDLTGDLSDAGAASATDAQRSRFASAFKDLGTWDHQEWEGGLQLNIPLGFRQGWAGVRQSQLQLARARAVLEQQQRQVALELSDAVAETHRAYEAVRVGYNRLEAAQADLLATLSAYEDAERASVELVLDSQQRLADARSRYYRSLTDYALSLKDVHLRKGSLLQYNQVFLSEGQWPRKAYRDAREVGRRWRRAEGHLYKIKPHVVSQGPFAQEASYDEENVQPPSQTSTDQEMEALPAPIPPQVPETADLGADNQRP